MLEEMNVVDEGIKDDDVLRIIQRKSMKVLYEGYFQDLVEAKKSWAKENATLDYEEAGVRYFIAYEEE